MHHRRLIIGSTLLALLAGACSSSPGGSSPTASVPPDEPASASPQSSPPAAPSMAGFACEGQTFAYASFGSQFPFFAVVDQSIKDAAERLGVNLVYLDNAFDPETSLNNANLIAARSDVTSVLFGNYFEPQNDVIAETIKAADKPLIALDTPIGDFPYYGGNNIEAGRLAGQGLVEAALAKFGGAPELVLVEKQTASGQQGLEDRANGIIEGVEAALPDLSPDAIVTFEGGANVEEAASAVAATLSAHPDASRVVIGMLGDSNGVAAANAAVEAGRGDNVVVGGMGGDQVAIDTLSGPESPFVGTSDWLPNRYGDDLLPLACEQAQGKTIPAETFVGHVFLTRDNLAEFHQ